MADFIELGYGNIAARNRIICVCGADSAPSRRMIQDAKDRGSCIDCCAGKKCRSVLVTDTDMVILTSLGTDEIKERLDDNE